MKMKKIHPHKDETYFYGFDDSCPTVGSGLRAKPLIGLSKSMLEWLTKNGLKIWQKKYNKI